METGSATYSTPPVGKRTSRLPRAEASTALSKCSFRHRTAPAETFAVWQSGTTRPLPALGRSSRTVALLEKAPPGCDGRRPQMPEPRRRPAPVLVSRAVWFCRAIGPRPKNLGQSRARRTSNRFPGSSVRRASRPANGTERALQKRSVFRGQAATKSVRERAWHSSLLTPLLAFRGEEVLEQFASLLALARIGLVADLEDGIGQQLLAFRSCLSGGMEKIQERVTHRPEFGQHQFGGIGGPRARATQSGLAQPLGDSLPRPFCSG